MKFMIGLLKFILIVAILYVASAGFAKSSYRVERSRLINASPKLVYNQIGILRNWEAWSPWREKDATVQNTYEGRDAENGSIMKWTGDKEKSGTGQITIIQADPPYSMLYKLSFLVPFEMSSTGTFVLSSNDPDKTKLNWIDSGNIPFLWRPLMMFMDMDQQMGPDFERGLFKIDSICSNLQKQMDAIMKDSLNVLPN